MDDEEDIIELNDSNSIGDEDEEEEAEIVELPDEDVLEDDEEEEDEDDREIEPKLNHTEDLDDDDDIVELSSRGRLGAQDHDDDEEEEEEEEEDIGDDADNDDDVDDDDIMEVPNSPEEVESTAISKLNEGEEDDDDDIMEIEESDPLGLTGPGPTSSMSTKSDSDGELIIRTIPNPNTTSIGEKEISKNNKENGQDLEKKDEKITNKSDKKEGDKDEEEEDTTIVVNDTKSLVELANRKNEPGKEPTLVIIDTNSILSGKGPVPLGPMPKTNGSSGNGDFKSLDLSLGGALGGVGGTLGGVGGNKSMDSPSSKYLVAQPAGQLYIPDDAFLIEAPSFIVPYVFEQTGEKTIKDTMKDLEEEIKKERERKLANNEPLEDTDEIKPPKKKDKNSEDYFDSPVGKLLMGLGMNLVQEYVQVDLLKMQKKKGEGERRKSKFGGVSMQTQQSIISLKQNIEESKENNEPFRHKMRKCELCNFKTESNLVMNTHLETPHMRNYAYRCNFCQYNTRVPQEILFHMEAEHCVKARLERAPAYHQCFNCAFEDNSKTKLTRHLQGCMKRFRLDKNLEPPFEWETPAKLPKLPPRNRFFPIQNTGPLASVANSYLSQGQGPSKSFINPQAYASVSNPKFVTGAGIINGNKMNLPSLMNNNPNLNKNKPLPGLIRTNPKHLQAPTSSQHMQKNLMGMGGSRGSMHSGMPQAQFMNNNHMIQQVVNSQLQGSNAAMGGFLSKMGMMSGLPLNKNAVSASNLMRNGKSGNQPSISITPLPRQSAQPPPSSSSNQSSKSQPGGKASFVICEICDGYIKDLDQLRNHMQWIHKVKIHPKMIYNKPPLNCQKCQFRFFTDQGLERHLLGSHGLVTSSMQDAANKGQDSGRCPLCGKVYQWKILTHVAKDHGVTLKPAHLSYKCTVCTATFGMYKLFESHVYSAHSMNTKRNNNNNNSIDNRRVNNNNPNNNRANSMNITATRVGGMTVTSSSSTNSHSNSNFKPLKINDEITIIPQPMVNSAMSRNKGSLTITPQSSATSRRMKPSDDDGIEIIEIDDHSPGGKVGHGHGRSFRENMSMSMNMNGEYKGRLPLPISDSTLRKRNLEISVCGESDNNSTDELYIVKGPPNKRICN